MNVLRTSVFDKFKLKTRFQSYGAYFQLFDFERKNLGIVYLKEYVLDLFSQHTRRSYKHPS